MQVHLVYVTKHQCDVLDASAVEVLREIFSEVCEEFKATLIEIVGDAGHVYLLVEYPPKVALSSSVDSLKGVSFRLLRKSRPDLALRYQSGVMWSPSYFVSCGCAPISIVSQSIEQQETWLFGCFGTRVLLPGPKRLGFMRISVKESRQKNRTTCPTASLQSVMTEIHSAL